MFEDTITLYHKTGEATWRRTVVPGIQWVDRYERQNESGRISVARYASITLPAGTYEGLNLDAANEEDLIVYGAIDDEVSDERGHRISDLMQKYRRSGRIKSLNNNSNRPRLKNIKIILG